MTSKANPVRFVPRGFVPTREQQDIQLSRHRVTLIEANAGAAKTTTLALRIGEAIARGMPPGKILALVFTPQARDVMKTRLVDIGIPHSTAAQIQVRTFEEFAGEVLGAIEGPGPARLGSAQELKPHALAAIEQVSLGYAGATEFLDIRSHNVAISQFLECQLRLKATMALDENDGDTGLEESAERLGVPLTDYLWTLEYERIRLGVFDEVLFRGPFDATYDLARQLDDFPETKNALPRYGLVAGDELHDLNEASFRVLEALLDMDDLYFVGAGDRDQVIHSSLGADESYLGHRFTDKHAGCVRYPLTMTYRHGPHLAYAMEAFKQKPVDSSLPVITEIIQLHYGQARLEEGAARVVDAIGKWKSDGFPLEACAILLRERHQSVAIENALMRANIGYRTQGMQGYLQREEILFLRGMIAIALKNLASVESAAIRKAIVESLAIFGEVAFTPQEMDYAKSVIAKDPQILNSFFTGQIQRSQSEKARTRISSAVAYMEGVAAETPADAVLRDICERMDLVAVAQRIYVHPHDAAVVAKSVDGFIEVARQSGMNLRQFSEWIGAADAFVATRRSRNLVLLECVANSKGKEFDHVILPFLENGEFPSPMRDLKEEENLFYVGATRARSRLTLISPEDESTRSPFIRRMELASSRARALAAVQKNLAQTGAAPSRLELRVPYSDKDTVKSLGAQWDAARKVWYVKAGLDREPFKPWFPEE
ncbi:ATP-dependent helicase [Pollutimonas bauzanensis]|uniref:DNA 3'-5' helicase n=1 Tax=Pollutimonas bauzanensis TaxID=658167 RepID=A0A1M5WWZ4_9BURK|nr:ATP-dependent helicase [Pollutimonas bauzanensis]SHH92176.1 DNA helicase-2 / ATP-dependent DNA helicase PcrA [Pollutimonas bauzanensis]